MTIRLTKKIGTALAIAALLSLTLAPVFTPLAAAQTPSAGPYSSAPGGVEKFNPLACISGAGTFCLLYLAALAAATISGILVGMGAFLVTLALNLNLAMLTTPAISAGFGVSLAVANLGFVLGIIVIAIATMLRLQSYGMKQLLLKLVAMAILVNFSMVIAVSIIRFSDSLSKYFLVKVAPTGESSNVFDATKSAVGYVTSMANAFAPQALFVTPEASWRDKIIGAVKALNPAETLKAIANLFFISFFTLIVVVAFFALGIMLFIRYAYLVILLVLMPLAWLLWVFPNFSKHFSDWWNKFLHWAFFPPLVLFFLYLAFFTMRGTGSAAFLEHLRQDAGVSDSSSPAVAFFEKVLIYPAKDFLGGIVGMMIAGALVFGGFFAANKFGIVGASAAMGSIKGLSRGAGKYVWSKGSGAAARYFGEPPAAGRARLPLQGLLAPRAITTRLEDAERARARAADLRAQIESEEKSGASESQLAGAKKDLRETEEQARKHELAAAEARARILRGEKPAVEAGVREPIWRRTQEALSRTLLVHGVSMATTPGLAQSLWEGATQGSGLAVFKKKKTKVEELFEDAVKEEVGKREKEKREGEGTPKAPGEVGPPAGGGH